MAFGGGAAKPDLRDNNLSGFSPKRTYGRHLCVKHVATVHFGIIYHVLKHV